MLPHHADTLPEVILPVALSVPAVLHRTAGLLSAPETIAHPAAAAAVRRLHRTLHRPAHTAVAHRTLRHRPAPTVAAHPIPQVAVIPVADADKTDKS